MATTLIIIILTTTITTSNNHSNNNNNINNNNNNDNNDTPNPYSNKHNRSLSQSVNLEDYNYINHYKDFRRKEIINREIQQGSTIASLEDKLNYRHKLDLQVKIRIKLKYFRYNLIKDI